MQVAIAGVDARHIRTIASPGRRLGVTLLLVTCAIHPAWAQSPQIVEVAPIAQKVVQLLSERHFEAVEKLFLPKMQAALPEDELRAAWNGVITSAGAFQKQDSVRVEAAGDSFRLAVVKCTFERAAVDVRLGFDSRGNIAGLSIRPAAPQVSYAPPAYAVPSRYTEMEVTVGAKGWPLPGTLSMPAGSGPFPAVVLVHGSGAQDRDATFGPNKIFEDLALGLSSRGVAVLRYEKRSRQHAARLDSLQRITVREEVLDDALAAAAWLRQAPRIDPRRVFVLGHSLGGMLVPRIASADSALRGCIVMAGAVRPLEQSIVDQTRYLALADGQLRSEEKEKLREVERLAQRVKTLAPEDANSTESIGGAPASYWLDLRGYDPPSLASTLPQPLLVLQGERDYQVTMADFERWKAALGPKRNATLKSYPSLDHLFLAGEGPSLPAEYSIPGHVAEEVIADIASWIESLP